MFSASLAQRALILKHVARLLVYALPFKFPFKTWLSLLQYTQRGEHVGRINNMLLAVDRVCLHVSPHAVR